MVSTVADGNMSFLWGEKSEVEKNREKFFEKIGINGADCVYTSLVHGNDVLMAGEKDKGKKLEADGFITLEKGVGIFLMTGDCLPVVFCDDEKGILGIAHLGWRGVDKELAGVMVKKLVELGSNVRDLHIWIGPGVRKETYWKYDRGVPEFLKSVEVEKWKRFLEDKPDGQLALDLVGYVMQQLIEEGVLKENIKVSEIDTVADRNYFSQFRSDKLGEPQGRFATVVIRR